MVLTIFTRAEDSDIEWLYGRWKSVNPSPFVRTAAPQNIHGGFQLPRYTKPSLRIWIRALLLPSTPRAAARRRYGPVTEKDSL